MKDITKCSKNIFLNENILKYLLRTIEKVRLVHKNIQKYVCNGFWEKTKKETVNIICCKLDLILIQRIEYNVIQVAFTAEKKDLNFDYKKFKNKWCNLDTLITRKAHTNYWRLWENV